MNNRFSSKVIKQHKSLPARIMQVQTPHGEFTTPCFMPVATRACVNTVDIEHVRGTGSQIILGGNTYHMLCKPGLETIKALGGMHKMMHWDGPMLTDSGGFQVFSLSKNSKICTINEHGAKFKHPDTGAVLHLTPETSVNAQKIIGADIIMAFDQCTPDVADQKIVLDALSRTHRWLKQSVAVYRQNPYSEYGHYQALFGIIQGGFYQDLRRQSAKEVIDHDLDGVAIGGESIGFDMHKTVVILNWLQDLLPKDKLRYTMGVGMCPSNLLDVVQQGVDIFDCVAPTRNARHGALYHGKIEDKGDWLQFSSEYKNNRINITKSVYAKDDSPILEGCECYTCKNYSRGYLHYLSKVKANNFSELASIHNIHVMQETCRRMRQKISEY